MSLNEEADDHSFPFPIIAEDTENALDNQHARAKTDYHSWKKELVADGVASGRNGR